MKGLLGFLEGILTIAHMLHSYMEPWGLGVVEILKACPGQVL